MSVDQLQLVIDRKFFELDTLYETKYAKIETGEKLGYRECGEKGKKPAILLIHGGLQSSLQMETLMKHLEPDFYCVAPCLRGHGFSSINNRIKTFHDFIVDMKNFMRQHIRINQYYVLGHSLGAAIAMQMACSLKFQILGCITLSSINPEGTTFEGFDEQITSPDQLKVKQVNSFYKTIIKKEQFDIYLDKFIKPIGKLPQPLTNTTYYKRWMYGVGRHRNPYDLMWVLAKPNFKVHKKIKNVQCPCYIVYGSLDYMSSVETGLKILDIIGKDRKDIELITFPECGHFPHLEKPELTAKHIKNFVEKNSDYKLEILFSQQKQQVFA